MKINYGIVNIVLTVLVAAIVTLTILQQNSEIRSLRSALTAVRETSNVRGDNASSAVKRYAEENDAKLAAITDQLKSNQTKLVSHGLEILSAKGQVVAALYAIDEGSQLTMQSLSKSGIPSTSVFLYAEDALPGLIVSKKADEGKTGADLWARYDPSGYYVQSGTGFDAKNPKLSASLQILDQVLSLRLFSFDKELSAVTELNGSSAFQQFEAKGRGRVTIAAEDEADKLASGESIFPASISIAVRKPGGDFGAGITLAAPTEKQSDSWAYFGSWNQEQGTQINATGVFHSNRDGKQVFKLGEDADNGDLILYDRNGTNRVIAGNNRLNNGAVTVYGPTDDFGVLFPTTPSSEKKVILSAGWEPKALPFLL